MPIRKPSKRTETGFIEAGANAETCLGKGTRASAEKKMFSARIDPETIRRVRIFSAQTGRTKEDIVQEALESFLDNHEG